MQLNIFYQEVKPNFLQDQETTTLVEKAYKIDRSPLQNVAIIFFNIISLGAFRLIQNYRFKKIFEIEAKKGADFEKARDLIQWGASCVLTQDHLLDLSKNKKVRELTFLFGQIDLPGGLPAENNRVGYFDLLPHEWRSAIWACEGKKQNSAWNEDGLEILDVWVKYTIKKLSFNSCDAHEDVLGADSMSWTAYVYEAFKKALKVGDEKVADIFKKYHLSLPFQTPYDGWEGIPLDKNPQFWAKNIKWLATAFDDESIYNNFKHQPFKKRTTVRIGAAILTAPEAITLLPTLKNGNKIVQLMRHTKEYARCMDALVSSVENPNEPLKDFDQTLPLIWAVKRNNASNIQELLAKGADVNIKCSLALMTAIELKNDEIAKILIEKGARIQLNHIELAIKQDNQSLVDLMVKKCEEVDDLDRISKEQLKEILKGHFAAKEFLNEIKKAVEEKQSEKLAALVKNAPKLTLFPEIRRQISNLLISEKERVIKETEKQFVMLNEKLKDKMI